MPTRRWPSSSRCSTSATETASFSVPTWSHRTSLIRSTSTKGVSCLRNSGSVSVSQPAVGARTTASTLCASSVATALASPCGSSYVSHSSSANPARLASEATPWISSPT